MPNTPPTSRVALVVPDAMPARARGTVEVTAAVMGAMTMPMPTPEHQHVPPQGAVGRGRRDPFEQQHADGGERHADRHRPARADPAGDLPGQRRRHDDRAGQRQHAQAHLQRRVALDVLPVEREEEEDAEHAEADQPGDGRAGGEGRVAEEAQRQHGARRVRLDPEERELADDAHGEQA